MARDHVADGGAKSRKLWFAIFTSIAIYVGAIEASDHQILEPLYSTMVGGLLGALGLYLGGNVATKVSLTKKLGSKPEEPVNPPVGDA